MFATVLMGVCSFVLLTGSAEQSRLEVTRTVNENFRSSYDILVRPRGSQTAIEAATSKVRPNYLSGMYGGISAEQVDQVQGLSGVEVAAPIAMIGQAMIKTNYEVDVTDLVREGSGLVRFSTTVTGDRGLSASPGPEGYVYAGAGVAVDTSIDDTSAFERHPGVSPARVCDVRGAGLAAPFSVDARWFPQCWDRQQGRYGLGWPRRQGRYSIDVPVRFPVTVAAIDPQTERELTGLDDAVDAGRYFRRKETSKLEGDNVMFNTLPVLNSSRSYIEEDIAVTADALDAETARTLSRGMSREAARTTVEAAEPAQSRGFSFTAQEAIDDWLAGSSVHSREGAAVVTPQSFLTVGQVDYDTRADGTLRARPVKQPRSVWRSDAYFGQKFAPAPWSAGGVGFRRIASASGSPGVALPALRSIGTFDPSSFDDQGLGTVPLETYQSPAVTAADTATSELLGDQDLLPDANPAGYLQSPPLLITTLDAADKLLNPLVYRWPEGMDKEAKPVSVIRVRVAGVTGADDISRERVRLVAEAIQRTTGLDVDITVGSSPSPTTVEVPLAGEVLSVSEPWVLKGVAGTVVQAIDRKSLALFLLVLLTAGTAISISANASVRARRTELGVLACLGWRPFTLWRHVMGQLVAVGVAAGVVGAVVSWPLGHLIGSPVSTARALQAVPAALLVMALAAMWPAFAAARAVPAEAVRPQVRAPRRAVRLTGPFGMARAAVARTPSRTLTGALALAVGVAALVSLLGISLGYQGAVVGSLLGDTVSVQVRGADIAAGVILCVIGLGAVADVLYLDIREQAAAYASLQASGWRDSTLVRLIVWQAAIAGTLGACAGAGAGLYLVSTLAPLNDRVVVVTVAVAASGVLAACVLALLPATSLRRLPTAQLLAEE